MGLWQSEIEEIRAMVQLFRAGKMTASSLSAAMVAFSQVQKRSENMLKEAYLEGKYGTVAVENIRKINLTSYNEVVELRVDLEKEKIVCPLTDEPITREACLDYSGSHNDDCANCENKKITQDRLLGEKV